MKILFVEDDDEKSSKISEFLNKTFAKPIITIKKSYHSGLTELVSSSHYDFVLMDMSMPNFDVTVDDPEGGSPESFAGRKLLEQMKFRYIDYPTIVITQYASFGEYVEKLSLSELIEELKNKYTPIYRSTVYYNSSESNWKSQLEKEIKNILEVNND